MADYSYRKVNPAFEPAVIEGATGLKILGVLDTPEEVVVVSVAISLAASDQGQLDMYMHDLGFEPVFP